MSTSAPKGASKPSLVSFLTGIKDDYVEISAPSNEKKDEKRSVKEAVAKVVESERKLVRSMLAKGHTTGLKGLKSSGKAKGAHQLYTTWCGSDSQAVTTSIAGTLQLVFVLQTVLSGSAGWTALSGVFDYFRVRKVHYVYQPYRKYRMEIGGSSLGSELSAGVPCGFRLDVDAPSTASALTVNQLTESPPMGAGLEMDSLGTDFNNTNDSIRKTVIIPTLKTPIVAATSSGAVIQVGMGNWIDCSLVGTMAGCHFIAGETDALAVSTAYGKIVYWFEVEFAIRV